MAMWAIFAAPLLMSVDLRTIKPDYKAILQNRQIIAVNQDRLGIQGRRIYKVWVCHGILLLFINKTYYSVLPTVPILKLDHKWAKVGYSSGYFAHCGKIKNLLSPKKFFVKSRNFCQKCVRENFRNFHTVYHSTVWKLRTFTLTLFWQKFRESNGFTNKITK